MPPAVVAIGERYEAEINALLERAYDEVMALAPMPDPRPQEHDALSLLFELAAVAGAKGVIVLAAMQPGAPFSIVAATGASDLLMRVRRLVDYALRMDGSTVQ
tara:strand:- start:503 stop:811 length:309 start_codon:yes stop_codon:yes gene_type:complete